MQADPGSRLPESLRERWDGPRWRRWALALGCALTALTALLAPLVALATGGDPASLALTALALESIVIAMIGAGLLERLSGRMIAGGLARQPHPDAPPGPAPVPGQAQARLRADADRERRDRTTIRAGLVVLPLFCAFLVLLFS